MFVRPDSGVYILAQTYNNKPGLDVTEIDTADKKRMPDSEMCLRYFAERI